MNLEGQPHVVSAGRAGAPDDEEERTGDRSEHGGADVTIKNRNNWVCIKLGVHNNERLEKTKTIIVTLINLEIIGNEDANTKIE